MEDWQLDFEWLRVRHLMQDLFKKETLPDLNAVLLLIGIQESGQIKPTYTKEEKQDLMHVAVCSLLTPDGYFEFKGLDHDGWPHYETLKAVSITGADNQERLLKIKVIEYFQSQGV